MQQNYSPSPIDHLPTRENQRSTPSRGQRMQRADPLVEQYIKYSPTRSANSPSKTSYIRMSPLVGARRPSPPHNEDLVKHMTHIPHDMANYSLSPIKAQSNSTRLQGPSSPERVSFGPLKQIQNYNFLPASNEKQQTLMQNLYQGRGRSPYQPNDYELRSQSSPPRHIGSEIIELSENGLPKIRGAEFGYPEVGGDILNGSFNKSASNSSQTYGSPKSNIQKHPEFSAKSTGLPSYEYAAPLSDGRRDYQGLNQSANKSRYTTPEKYSETLSKPIEEPYEVGQETHDRNGMMQIVEEERESEFSQRGIASAHRTPMDKTKGSPGKSPHLSADQSSAKKGAPNRILQEINEENTARSHQHESPAKLLQNCAMILEPEIADNPQDARFFPKMERAKSKAIKPENADDDTQVVSQRIRPSPVKVTQNRSRPESPTKYLNESGRSSARSERRSAGESLNVTDLKLSVIPEKTLSDKILSADNIFKINDQGTKPGSSASKYDRFVISEERTNEGSSPYSQKKAALRRLSNEMRASATSFESDKPENNERSLLYGKESPIKGGFTFPHEEYSLYICLV